MRIMFGNWKYMFKNFWYVIFCGFVPAVFLALTFDYAATSSVVRDFFAGRLEADFLLLLRTWSIIRIDSALGGIYTLFAYLLSVLFAALLLAIVEKHMRIGKRTFNGVGTQLKYLLLPAACVVLLFFALQEVFAIILSSLTFAILQLQSVAVVYVLCIAAFLLALFIFLYVIEVFYLWLPCLQITGFRPYNAFLYAYRLSVGVRWKLMGAHALSLAVLFVAIAGAAFQPEPVIFHLIAFLFCLFYFASFFIRMETVYFETDKLDREDIIKSYKEL